MTAGFDISLAGIDGIGKTSVSNALAEELRARGYRVTVTSWRDYFRREQPEEVLPALHTTMFRALFDALVDPAGNSASQLLPVSDQDFRRVDGEPLPMDGLPVPVALDTDRPGTFLAVGLMKVAAAVLERETVITPALARGDVVIQDSHALKHAVKLAAFTASLAGDDVTDYLAFARRCLGQWAAPTVSVLVSGDPHLAYRWRKAQNGHIGRFEHLDVDRRPAESTFVEFQTLVQRRLGEVADAERWVRVTMTDRPRERNVAEAVATVLDVLAERGLVPAGARS